MEGVWGILKSGFLYQTEVQPKESIYLRYLARTLAHRSPSFPPYFALYLCVSNPSDAGQDYVVKSQLTAPKLILLSPVV